MKDNRSKMELKACFDDAVKNFKHYHNRLDQYRKIFTELGFAYVNYRCSGFCPECEQKMRCLVYEELKDEWEVLYPNINISS
jgi:hypothetical protein